MMTNRLKNICCNNGAGNVTGEDLELYLVVCTVLKGEIPRYGGHGPRQTKAGFGRLVVDNIGAVQGEVYLPPVVHVLQRCLQLHFDSFFLLNLYFRLVSFCCLVYSPLVCVALVVWYLLIKDLKNTHKI